MFSIIGGILLLIQLDNPHGGLVCTLDGSDYGADYTLSVYVDSCRADSLFYDTFELPNTIEAGDPNK